MTCKRIVHLMSRPGLALLLCLTAGIRPGIAAADLGSSFQFDIPAQPLPYALLKYSEQSGVQVTSPGRLLEKRSSSGVVGTFEAKDALRRLLEGTDLGYDIVDRNTVVITSSARPGAQQPHSREGAQGPDLWGPFRVARSNMAQTSGAAEVGADAKEPAAAANLEEVVVTAQKRKERLVEVPVPVTAVSASVLIDSNELRLQDYYSSVPGLDLTLDNRGSPVISIRGVTTSFYTSGSTPTVGITIDDVPYENTGPSTFSPIPDIDPNELERVEVLRGPQGTLYGSSSIGGLVKYVTIDPSTARVSAYASAGLTAVENGHKEGYNASAGVNLPLNDAVALRVSGFTHDDPAYIDNVQTGQQGVNERKVYGGRISGLWRPSDDFSLKLGALYQDSKAYGPSQIDVPTPGYSLPPLGDLQQSNLIGTGGYDRRIQGYSANIDARLGEARLTSVTGYDISRSSDSFDFTYVFGPFTQMKFGVAGTAFAEDNTARKFSQELRLAVPLGPMFDWLIGAFYTHEQTTPVGGDVAIDPATGVQVGRWLDQRSTETYTEAAGFTDLTVHFTDRFDVQVGGRYSVNRTTNESILIGPYVPYFLREPSPDINPEVGSKDHAFTYLVTPKYSFSRGLMVYARLASGFRPGGPNSAINARLGLPASYSPDTTRNYELGVKGDLLEHTLSFDASVYYIDWRNIQITLYDPSTSISYGANGSRAKSQGEELSLQSRPVRGLSIEGWVTWSDAVLTQPFPAAPPASGLPNAAPGDRLPYGSRFSGHVSIEQDFPLFESTVGFIAASASYVGDRKGEFTNAPPRQDLPAYTIADLRLGAHYGPWTGNLFVTNIADRRGLLQGGIGFFPPYAFDVVQPRTMGLTVSRSF